MPRSDGLRELNANHETFCLEYLKDHNATRAYKAAGYSPKGANQSAAVMLRDPLIKARIAALASEKFKALHMEVDEILARAALIARADIRMLFDEKGNLKPMHELGTHGAATVAGVDVTEEFDGTGAKRRKVGETRKVRLRDPMPALRLLAEHKKLVKMPDAGVNALATMLAERMKAAREARKAKERKP